MKPSEALDLILQGFSNAKCVPLWVQTTLDELEKIRNLYSASEQIAKFNTDERDLELDDVIEMYDLVYFLKRN